MARNVNRWQESDRSPIPVYRQSRTRAFQAGVCIPGYSSTGVIVPAVQVYFGTQHAKMYLNADLLGINCVTGMSCLFRRAVVDDAGGFAYLGRFLAEDYYLSKLFIDRGWRVRVCSQPAMQNPGVSSVANFQARMMRSVIAGLRVNPFRPDGRCETYLFGASLCWPAGLVADQLQIGSLPLSQWKDSCMGQNPGLSRSLNGCI